MKVVKIVFWAIGSMLLLANAYFYGKKIPDLESDLTIIFEEKDLTNFKWNFASNRVAQFERGDITLQNTQQRQRLLPHYSGYKEQERIDLISCLTSLVPITEDPGLYRARWGKMSLKSLYTEIVPMAKAFKSETERLAEESKALSGKIKDKRGRLDYWKRLTVYVQMIGLGLIFSVEFWGRLKSKE